MQNNTTHVKAVSNSINTLRVEENSLTDKAKNFVSNIVSKIKDESSQNLKYILVFALPIIILLCYFLYKYNFSSRTKNVIAGMNYKPSVTFAPLPQCYQQDLRMQYKLCDYYVNSSFMTPCVGNQHYDYVSNDMIAKVMQLGARYIQIPICEEDVTNVALPVVATAEYGQRVITSLNTLEIRSVLNTIRGNAFEIQNKTTNYPLIIHLILNTQNKFTLDTLADNIQEVLSDVLIDVKKYQQFPIFLEKLCNLLNKIIIIATPEYMGTNLESYVVPTSKLCQIYNFSELGPLNLPNEIIHKNLYNNKLSTKQQDKSNALFKKKYPTIDYIVENADTIGETIIKDKDILNNLTSFNKIGVTIVKPLNSSDVSTTNFEFAEAIYYGCQFIAMNFQTNDTLIKEYLDMFKESSFRLKPASMRFTEQEVPSKNILSAMDLIIKTDNNIINDFYSKYSNMLIVFESYTLPNTYLTQIEYNLKFNVGSTKTVSKNEPISYSIATNQCFIPRKSTIGTSNNVSIYLESAAMPGYYVTLNGNRFGLQTLGTKKQDLINQAFYVVKPRTIDGEDKYMISIKTTSVDNPIYIAFENKTVKAYPDSTQIQAHNNMTFFIDTVNFQIVVQIITLFNGSLKTMNGSNIVGVIENNVRDGTSYIVVPTSQYKRNFDIFSNQFMLMNKNTNTYVVYDPETYFLYDTGTSPNSNGVFSLTFDNGYYNIINNNGDNLVVFNKNLIKFVNNDDVVSNENMFKLTMKYEILT